LYTAIIEKLQVKNSDVKKSLLSKNPPYEIDLNLVQTVPWESNFQPLSKNEIMEIWDRLYAEHEDFPTEDKMELLQLQF
jgi:hypothetical protein